MHPGLPRVPWRLWPLGRLGGSWYRGSRIALNCGNCACRESCPRRRPAELLSQRPAVMISGQVPAVRVPPDHAASSKRAAVPAQGSEEERRDLDPPPPAHRPATLSAVPPPEADLGGPGPARDPAQRDTESASWGLRLLVTPGTILRWHRDILLRRCAARSMRGKTGRPAPRQNIRALALRQMPAGKPAL